MLGQGHTLRLLEEAQEVRRHQYPEPENQDSQHMIDQPRGSFPEFKPSLAAQKCLTDTFYELRRRSNPKSKFISHSDNLQAWPL